MQSNLVARIGEIVRSERERQGLTQEELALAAGVSYRTVLQIEKGKATSRLDVLVRVLEALGLTLEVRSGSRSLTRSASAPLGIFEVDRDRSGAYRWRLKAPNGEILAQSVEDYTSKATALNAVQQITSIATKDDASGRRAEVFRADDGSYRWRLTTPGGRVIASSNDGHDSRTAARRAAHHALLAASAAEIR